MKIFCSNCVFLFEVFTEDMKSIYSCNPNIGLPEKSEIINDTWFKQGRQIITYKDQKPEELNRNNDCLYFKPLPVGTIRRVVYQ